MGGPREAQHGRDGRNGGPGGGGSSGKVHRTSRTASRSLRRSLGESLPRGLTLYWMERTDSRWRTRDEQPAGEDHGVRRGQAGGHADSGGRPPPPRRPGRGGPVAIPPRAFRQAPADLPWRLHASDPNQIRPQGAASGESARFPFGALGRDHRSERGWRGQLAWADNPEHRALGLPHLRSRPPPAFRGSPGRVASRPGVAIDSAASDRRRGHSRAGVARPRRGRGEPRCRDSAAHRGGT